ncbi:MAG TPA: VTT domain-containing protein [Amaricoccus sp.]|uniref:YqaA family protein n=1 Tax=Amaricoccus sp. TaxID=1872485 RepID=UPI001D5938B3|nr:VTT domain-containing protein [Amaricoccus sp.]MCB1373495.1 DedA family protein [Paracoccaceae bacterium]MCC0067906.1 DedA family protein [Rhodovulum sp.]MCB1403982.1 DedA family protein [Paracoccaceae bacterium]HMQ94312.1 VTT domain-containing protein [Amaricoccus sp.]HMR53976.1 VTT domain-containing protein [Amaricoccus sp.]
MHPARDASDILDRIVQSRWTGAALFGFAFLEGAVLPIPIEAVIAPLMQLRRDRIWRIAAIAFAGYLASALAGYAIGALFFDTVGARIVAALGWEAGMAQMEGFLARYGFWAMMAMAVTPLPTQVAMIGAGLFGLSLPVFVLAIVLGRGTRNFAVAALVWRYGDRVVARLTRDQPPR